MRISNVVIVLGCLTASITLAQGPMYDRVEVDLPYAVTINNTVLQPGHYTIRQHESTAGGSRIVHIFSDNGMKLETTAMGIPALDNRTPEHTKVVLNHIGEGYYLNKIWVQGKDYGYEFPIPENVRMRERELSAKAPVAVVAQSTTTEKKETEERTEIAKAAPPPEPPRPEPPAATPAPEPAPAPAPAPVQAQPEPSRVQADQAPEPRKMPSTSANWLSLIVGGGLLTSSGLALRRFQS
jgi:hypothetical protein